MAMNRSRLFNGKKTGNKTLHWHAYVQRMLEYRGLKKAKKRRTRNGKIRTRRRKTL